MITIIILIIIGILIIYPLFRIIQQMYGHPMNGYMEDNKLLFLSIIVIATVFIFESIYYNVIINKH